jgi:VWFA-related protein
MTALRWGVMGLALWSLAPASPGAQQPPVFRTTTATVTVNASVKRGNRVVANLTAADFYLTDNRMNQKIEALSIESVPIDVTLFLDTSGSTAGKLDEMTHDVQEVVKMLRPGDRFRLLTIADSVVLTVPWVAAGTKINVSFQPVGGISLINDALMFGLVHRADTGRRHLIVGMTDRMDCGSVVPVSSLLELAGRSESVMHLVDYAGGGGEPHYRIRACTPRGAPGGANLIEQAAMRTGGELHRGSWFFRSASILRAFKVIFDEFRQSYVLRYSPTNTGPGWHAIVVTLPGVKDAVVRARQGYYGE